MRAEPAFVGLRIEVRNVGERELEPGAVRPDQQRAAPLKRPQGAAHGRACAFEHHLERPAGGERDDLAPAQRHLAGVSGAQQQNAVRERVDLAAQAIAIAQRYLVCESPERDGRQQDERRKPPAAGHEPIRPVRGLRRC